MAKRTVDKAPGQYYAPTRLGDKQALTPEGFLLCSDVPLARTGNMLYTQHDFPSLKAGDDGYIRVTRDDGEVFRPETIASFEGKPVTDDHPDDDVTPDNWKEHAVGYVQNVRRGMGFESDLLLGDILITHREAIDAVRDGKREVSCGYDADYEQVAPGHARQHTIIGNHVALVTRGRCGSRCAIGDKETDMTAPNTKLPLKDRLKAAFLTRDEKALDAALAEAPAEGETPGVNVHIHTGTKDAGDDVAALKAENAALKKAATADKKGKDDDMTEEEKAAKKKAEDAAAELLEEERAGAMDDGLLEEEEEEGNTKDAAPALTYTEIVASAEIIAPGFRMPKLTKDAAADPKKTRDGLCIIKRRALDAAMKNEVGKAVVTKFLRGRTVDKLSCSAVDAAFVAATELVKETNNLRVRAKDAAADNGTKTTDAWKRGGIDAINANYWKTQNKQGA